MKQNFTKLKVVLLAILISLSWLQVEGQSFVVGGKVTDDNGDPLPGVNVLEKGTTNGSVTDVDGNYSISVSGKDAVLIFSFIGYTTQEAPLNGRSAVNISMLPDIKTLSEVVVVGYGTQRKIETTGAIASVKSEELLQTPVANVAQGLQARVAGVQITQNSGSPGGSISVRIRGTNSVNGSSEPLYIVDGIQIDNSANTPSAQVTIAGNVGVNNDNKSSASISPLNSINPNDIESIEVLKDASAAAIYGSRAANGVVIITTKQGTKGATSITYDGYYGVQQVNKTIPMLNGEQFAELENDIFANPNRLPDPPSFGKGTDWQNVIFRSAPIQNHQITIAGGNETTKFSVGLNNFRQEGIVINSDYTRYSLRLNLTHQANKWLKVGTSIIGTRGITDRVQTAGSAQDGANQGVLGAALAAPPILKPYDDLGGVYQFAAQPYGNYYGELRNPLAIASIYDRTTSDNLLANLFFEFNLAKGLTYRPSFNVNKNNGLTDIYVPRSLQSEQDLASTANSGLGGVALKINSNAVSLLHESILTYATKFGNDHSFKVTGVYGYQKNTSNSNTINASRFPSDATKNEAVQLAAAYTVSSNRSEDELVSFMARVNYGFKDKYFLDVTTRVDGSSKFGKDNKYGVFPAVGVSWRIIEESFLRNVTFLSDLKFRGSYGQTGNAAGLSAYQSLGLVAANNSNSYTFNNRNSCPVKFSEVLNARCFTRK